MKAGRELDALIAERVMGEMWGVGPNLEDTLPHYSTQIADAWLVVEKMRPYFEIYCDGGGWVARFGWADAGTLAAYADTAPLAICLAALKAVE